jgi:hypothetical protein
MIKRRDREVVNVMIRDSDRIIKIEWVCEKKLYV